MNIAYPGAWPQLADYDAFLMDVARRIQLPKSKHEIAETNFRALCQHVDRKGSPLENKVIECYPSGSFAIGAAIAASVAKDQHDVDVVMELDISPYSPPKDTLRLLFLAIDGEFRQPISRHGGTEKSLCNRHLQRWDYSRSYADRPHPGPDRTGHLFHYKRETGVSYHKEVNPWGFAKYFNDHVEYDPAFHDLFKGRRLLVEGQILEKADTQPMPDHVPIEEKSARVVALQLLKRARNISWRAPSRQGRRKPISVALAAMSLDAGPVQHGLLDEVVAIAGHIRSRLTETDGPRGTVHVINPAYPNDVFTDRWPENKGAQDLYDGDLRGLIVDLYKLRNDKPSLAEQQEILKRLFGESAANYAIESKLISKRHSDGC